MEKNIRHTEEFEEERLEEKSSVFERFQLTLTFDKMVIASISMVVLLAITFAMGVERGKQKAIESALRASQDSGKTVIQQEWSTNAVSSASTESETTALVSEALQATETSSTFALSDAESQLPMESVGLVETQPVTNSFSTNPGDLTPQAAAKKNSGSKKENIPGGAYTVRLASYVKPDPAKNTADRLKKKGYETFVKQSGKYYVLNVGRFGGKQAAQETLGRLRKELGLPKEGFVLKI
ncbi:MAG: SPOR domain-containing protein [Candidatus Omnitrophica bacterium]|nr:SPOR domain-containing protein [Candidatus Omnitrophota bacterium]